MNTTMTQASDVLETMQCIDALSEYVDRGLSSDMRQWPGVTRDERDRLATLAKSAQEHLGALVPRVMKLPVL